MLKINVPFMLNDLIEALCFRIGQLILGPVHIHHHSVHFQVRRIGALYQSVAIVVLALCLKRTFSITCKLLPKIFDGILLPVYLCAIHDEGSDR